jgi:23S rRNA (adenine2503-C2)-methyltransferase
MTSKSPFYDLEYQQLKELISEWGEAGFRADQIWQGVYIHLKTDFDQFTTLPASLRQRLAEEYTLQSLVPVDQLSSSDGQTTKMLFQLPDGSQIESVLMKYDKRRTLCISTQAGCAMGCTFCATGQMGFTRNLSSGEIIAQVLYFARLLAEQEERVTNIVYMGMGEPFHNYDATLKTRGAAFHHLNCGANSRNSALHQREPPGQPCDLTACRHRRITRQYAPGQQPLPNCGFNFSLQRVCRCHSPPDHL